MQWGEEGRETQRLRDAHCSLSQVTPWLSLSRTGRRGRELKVLRGLFQMGGVTHPCDSADCEGHCVVS